jgi:HAD superfamily hydrolase (TIGR01509 family)
MTNIAKAIIFDLDGVIVDTEPLNKICMSEFLVTLGLKNPGELPANLQGLNTKAYWTLVKSEYGLNTPIEEIVVRWRPYYLAYLSSLDQIPVIPGIPELIECLQSANYHLAIASSANPKRIKLILDKTGLAHPFSVIVDGDSYKQSKPAPDCFLLAAKRLGMAPEDCIVIEDSNNGVQAAKAANIRCIGYGGSAHNNDDLSQADVVITDFTHLLRSLRSGQPLVV